MMLTLAGAESIWVSLGETAAVRIYFLVVIKNTHGNTAFMLGTIVFLGQLYYLRDSGFLPMWPFFITICKNQSSKKRK